MKPSERIRELCSTGGWLGDGGVVHQSYATDPQSKINAIIKYLDEQEEKKPNES